MYNAEIESEDVDNPHILQLQDASNDFVSSIAESTFDGIWFHLHFPTPQYKRFKRSLERMLQMPKIYLDQSRQRIRKAVEQGEQFHGQCFVEQMMIEKKFSEEEIPMLSSFLVGGALDTVSCKEEPHFIQVICNVDLCITFYACLLAVYTVVQDFMLT